MQLTNVGITGGRLDTAVARGFALLADGWRRLTGRSHFVLAKFFLFLAALFDVVAVAEFKFSVGSVFAIIVGAWFYWYCWVRVLGLFEDQHDNLGDVLPVALISQARFARLMRWASIGFFAFNLVVGGKGAGPSVVTDVGLAGFFFLVTLIGQPPAKSLVRQMVDSFRQHGLRPIYIGG